MNVCKSLKGEHILLLRVVCKLMAVITINLHNRRLQNEGKSGVGHPKRKTIYSMHSSGNPRRIPIKTHLVKDIILTSI